MRPFPLALAFAIATGCFQYANAEGASSRLSIGWPREETTVSSPLRAVAVAACDRIRSIGFEADFGQPDAKGDTVLLLGPIAHPPLNPLRNTYAPPGMAFSPYYWNTVNAPPRPLHSALSVLWLLSFGAGLVPTLLFGLVFLLFRKMSVSFGRFEQSEEEKRLSDQIYQFIGESVTKKDLTLHWVAKKLELPPKKVESVIRRHKEQTFKDFMMFLRIEIAKERLRSSNSSETSIAKSCGFKNVGEMERFFTKFCRTTPFKFRKENQVA